MGYSLRANSINDVGLVIRPELVRTVREIAKIIGRTERGTRCLLERNPGAVPGAFKEGGRWCMDVGVWCRKTRERAEKQG